MMDKGLPVPNANSTDPDGEKPSGLLACRKADRSQGSMARVKNHEHAMALH
jgi:hypothetical protein